MEKKVYLVTSLTDNSNKCRVVANDYADAISKIQNGSSFMFIYGSGFSIKETNDVVII